jgi:putative ABC transport system substrate-binding protein
VNRRELLARLLGGAAAAWPAAVGAQPAKLRTIGFLGVSTPSTQGPWTAIFVQRLQELGWVEGRNVKIEVRWAEGRNERFAEIAAEFVQRNVDVIVTAGGAVPAVKQATSVIPIVFALANDPVGSGYVASLSRPSGNVTGLSLQSTDLVGKRLELLRELLPTLGRLAIMGGPPDNPSVLLEIDEVKEKARTLGIGATVFEVARTENIAPAFQALKGKVEALYVVGSPLTTGNRIRISTLALGAHLPTVSGFRDYVEMGGLMSYGPDLLDLWRRAGDYVDKILRGAKPAQLPVEQPTKFDLVLNLIAAQALDLTVPPSLLARADMVIE